MKKNTVLVIVFTAILAGFSIGWLSKPSDDHTITASENQTIKPSENQIWTCSMHPQIRQNEPGKCPICEMDLIPLVANTSNDPLVLQMTEAAIKLAQIETTTIGAQIGGSGKSIPLSGKVQADERLASSQVAHVPGRIEKLFVTFTGEQVKQGQKLATLYSPQLITAQQELLEAQKLSDVNPGLVEAARNKLRFWKIGDEAIKAIEQNRKVQETFTLFADESGIVTKRRVAVGDYVKQGEPLFDLMNLGKVWVLFDAYEEDLSSISLGDQIEFSTPSNPNRKFQTRITFIDPVINPLTRVASLRTEVNNANGLLKPEMFVTGIYHKKATSKTQLTVPKSAVLWTGKRSVVYVKLPDATIPSFKFKEVELGEAMGNSYLVLEGLEDGEEVVTNGNFTIDAAAQLNNQASMMNKDVLLKKEAQGIPDFQAETPAEFKKQLKTLTDSYLSLKNAFVNTDPAAAATTASNFTTDLKKVDMELLKGDAHMYWMQQLKVMQQHGKMITGSEDVEHQRKQFGFLSSALIKAVTAFGTDGGHLYVQFCPMAFDNVGADWLAREEEIRNPYFGKKMMTCGSVKADLSK